MDHILAIYDSEKKYVKKLAAYFEQQNKMPFQIMAFDNMTKLIRFFGNKPAAVLLIDEESWELSLKELAEQTILLTDRKERELLDSFMNDEEIPAVCKYQSGEAIAKKVLGICAVAKAPIRPLYETKTGTGKKAEVIGIYTPVKRSLQTSFALTYSSLCAKSKKTLYLNFEVFSGFSVWFEKEYGTDLMDLMYFLDGPSDKFLLKLAGMAERFGGFHYVPPAISYEDFMLVKEYRWVQLIQTIADKSDYEVVILDLGDQMQGLFGILSLCDKIFTIYKSDGLAMAKLQAFEESLKISKREDILEKIIKCRLPVFKEIPQSAQRLTYSQLADYIKNKLGETF